jgi:hypothetical protein
MNFDLKKAIYFPRINVDIIKNVFEKEKCSNNIYFNCSEFNKFTNEEFDSLYNTDIKSIKLDYSSYNTVTGIKNNKGEFDIRRGGSVINF